MTAEELDKVYRAAETHVDELKQAIRYLELAASHLTAESMAVQNMVKASTAVLQAHLVAAAYDRDQAAEAVRIAWEAGQPNVFQERLDDKAT